MANKTGLYIHIPFCIRKCNYCAFLSFCSEGAPLRDYTNALVNEIKLRASLMRAEAGLREDTSSDGERTVSLDTVYIGGGTPSVLDVSHMRDIVYAVQASFDIKKNAEITIEANPGTLGDNERAIRDRLQAYRSMGINRFSMGVQSMNDNRLRFLGRIHTAEDVELDMKIAREVGFDNINLDLIFSVPGESMDDALSDAQSIVEFRPEHISCYSLQIEEGTAFANQIERGVLTEVSDEEDRETYHRLCSILKSAGYEHYEISNFARTGREDGAALGFGDCDTDSLGKSIYRSKHNSLYWDMSDYIGCGLGASGFVHGTRYRNTADIDKYIERYTAAYIDTMTAATHTIKSDDEERPSTKEHLLLHEEEWRNSPFDNISEAVFTGLRRREGITYKDAVAAYTALECGEEVTGNAEAFFWKVFGEARTGAEEFVESGHLIIDDKGLRLTEKGIDISNQIMALFV
ncbi:MAG: radical SAM family heme chaperone HemW [Mogibacterium sp.]|nr:radical SAM family heme chaperone HemW [Mogibacterium sp.]